MRSFILALALIAASPPQAAVAATPGRQDWSLWLFVDGYLQPGDAAYLVPTVFLDREPLHLEARYNYEDLDTGSLFAGWTFELGGEQRSLRLTPMVGGAVGRANGVAPGLEVEARLGRLAYWLEGEYFLDLGDRSEDFLYTWSELNLFVGRRLWVGGSLQRLRPVRTGTELDVGPMVGAGRPGLSVSLYGYALWTSEPWFLVTLALSP